MDDIDDPAMKAVLSRARRSWSPGPGDIERLRRGVDAALAHGAPSATPAAGAPAALTAHAWVRRALVTVAFTAAGAGAGYWAGRRAERRVATVQVASAASPPVMAGNPPSLAPAPASPPAIVPTPAAHRPERGRHVTAASPPSAPAESLAAEVRALRNVERALRDRNPGLAGAFLDDLDRTVPVGQMREERLALRAIARCMTGSQPFGVDLAEEFGAAYPGSAYRARIAQACDGTDSRSTGDSRSRR